MEVRIWEEDVIIPTYEVGKPNKNPMFLEKRVYQGSSGKVYPYPVTETISHEKTDKTYRAVYLENDYLKIMILPELGGRIQRAFDKTNQYDFVYYNRVIKPALVGLCGPWISGGIEFNWPQHHRPTTYSPVDYLLKEHEDGSKTLLVNDVDQMYGTKGSAAFTLYPDKAYLEIRGQLYNGTSLPQTFLWWANPAVAVNDHTQSIFPPDVHNVFDHGKRAVSTFPIATGEYYKHDYSAGVDISRYKNIPVPTSYMAETSRYDFVGGYDYEKEAGLLHVADHHISPGKKQWTWGCGDFGKAWDRNLTDEDGPYIELMTGVYTENQPDFTWLKPFEEKTFVQYFMPYKKVGAVKNATIDAALNAEFSDETVTVTVYATASYPGAEILITRGEEILCSDKTDLSPETAYQKAFALAVEHPEEVTVWVRHQGKVLVSYTPEPAGTPAAASPAEEARAPESIETNEELLLTAQHIEQHRHATYLPDPYYLEGLRRDPGDMRINDAYGMLLMRRGRIEEAEPYFRAAIARMTWRSPNPYLSEPYYHLGLCLLWQNREPEAYDAFYKATWSSEQQEMSFYYLALLCARQGDFSKALSFVERSLVKNSHNLKARGLKAALLRRLGQHAAAENWTADNLALDPFDYVSRYEQALLSENAQEKLSEMNRLMRQFPDHYLESARDYASFGFFAEAVAMLRQCHTEHPLLCYYEGYYLGKLGDAEGRAAAYRKAEALCPDCCFPNKLDDIPVLEDAAKYPESAKALYYLGCLYYDKLQFEKAQALWEASIEKDDTFATAHRNLGLALYNKAGDANGALEHFKRAFALDPTDARVFLELDQLQKRMGVSANDRLAQYEAHRALVEERDDTMLELVTLYNLTGQHQQALDTIQSHIFRPWEGAEGRISGQYKLALRSLAGEAIRAKAYEKAKALLLQGFEYPSCLGEGRLEGTKDNDLYYALGVVYDALGEEDSAKAAYDKATLGGHEPAGVQYYYDQPADMILYQALAYQKLGEAEKAASCLEKLWSYGQTHENDSMKNDFFAVSLPDFLIFEDDIDQKNKAHCRFLMGLSLLGQQKPQQAAQWFEKALETDGTHAGSQIYHRLCQQKGEPI